MTEPIVGIDGPEDFPRPPWWQIAVLLLVAAAVVFWIADLVHSTDTERAAKQFDRLVDALSEQDGDEFCELLTPEGREEMISSGAVTVGPGADCEETADAQLAQFAELGVDLEELSGFSPGDFEDDIVITGDRARISTADELTEANLELVKVDGNWLFEVSGADAEPAQNLPPSASEADLIHAADRLCITGFGRSSVAIGRLVEGEEGFEEPAGDWLANEETLLSQIDELAAGRNSPALNTLLEIQREHVAVVRQAIRSRRSFLKSTKEFTEESRSFVAAATDAGFTEFGCAAPAGGG